MLLTANLIRDYVHRSSASHCYHRAITLLLPLLLLVLLVRLVHVALLQAEHVDAKRIPYFYDYAHQPHSHVH
jgi:hypothetical protein